MVVPVVVVVSLLDGWNNYPSIKRLVEHGRVCAAGKAFLLTHSPAAAAAASIISSVRDRPKSSS